MTVLGNEPLGIVAEGIRRRALYEKQRDVPQLFARPAKVVKRPEPRIYFDRVSGRQKRPVTPEIAQAVIQVVCEVWQIRYVDIISSQKERRVAYGRFAAIRLIRQLNPTASTPQIGIVMGGRDHTTVLSATRRAEELHATDSSWRALYDKAEAMLLNA